MPLGGCLQQRRDCAPSKAAANWRREKAGPDMLKVKEVKTWC